MEKTREKIKEIREKQEKAQSLATKQTDQTKKNILGKDILGIYRHYKGKEYEVIAIAHHSETHEKLVVYKALYNSEEFGNNAIWVRPIELFHEEVTINGKHTPRFTLVQEKENNETKNKERQEEEEEES